MAKPLGSLLFTLAIAGVQPAGAQQYGFRPPSAGPLGLPNIGSISAGNAAGLLQYCVEHKLVSSSSADIVLSGLGQKKEVTSSPDYAAGKSGRILGGAKGYSLGQAQSYVQSTACDQVLKRAKTFM